LKKQIDDYGSLNLNIDTSFTSNPFENKNHQHKVFIPTTSVKNRDLNNISAITSNSSCFIFSNEKEK
jgi:hypothetical protein